MELLIPLVLFAIVAVLAEALREDDLPPEEAIRNEKAKARVEVEVPAAPVQVETLEAVAAA